MFVLRLRAAIGRFGLIALMAAGSLAAPRPAQATNVSGDQAGIWSATGNPYLVTGDIVVPAGQTLTIEPGVQVRFTLTGQRFDVFGTLSAQGTAAAPITFQSSRPSAVPGEWISLAFRTGSTGTLSQCSLSNGGALATFAPTIIVESPNVTIQDCIIEKSDGPGMVIAGIANTALFERLTIRDNRFAAIVQTTADMAPRFAALSLTGNGRNGVVIPGGRIPPLLRLDGPTQLNGSPFFVEGPLAVQPGQTLSVTTGTELQFAVGAGLEVSGTIAVEGTILSPVRFTASPPIPSAGSWRGIRFSPSANGRMNNCTVEFAGVAAASLPAIQLDAPEVELRNCLINRSGWHGIVAGSGGGLENVIVRASLGYGVVQSFVDLGPTFRNLNLIDNLFNAVRIPGGGFIRDRVLNGAALNGAPIVFDGSANIQSGATVTVTAGTRLRLAAGSRFEVLGRLVIDGSVAQPVEIASDRRLPAPGDWQALVFRPGSSGRLTFCSIAHGGSAPANGEVLIESSSVTIADCAIRTSLSDGIRIEGAGTSPTLERVFFGRNQGAAVRQTSASQSPILRNLVFFGNGVDGVVTPGGTITNGRSAAFSRLAGGLDKTVWTLLTLGTTNGLGEGDFYAGGGFRNAGTGSANFVARWSAATQQWMPAGGGTNGPVRSLVRRPASSVGTVRLEGETIYAGGSFTQAGGISANNVAQYDPSTLGWASLGSGTNGPVTALIVDGSNVFVGGSFSQAGGQSSSNFAVWDSSSQGWNAISNGPNGAVASVAVDGSSVFVGGAFTAAGGVTGTSGVAGYNSLSGSWSTLSGGVDGSVNAIVAVGGLVYVGGSFNKAGAVSANNVAVWDSQTGIWSALGSGVNGPVFSLSLDSAGLVVGGTFSQAGGQAASNLAMYDGAAWHPMSSGTNDTVYAVVQSGSSVAVAGSFSSAGGESMGYITRFGTPRYGLALAGVGARG